MYYRGEKIGFTVSQVQPTDDGFELKEDGHLQFTLLGAHTFAVLKTTANVDRSFALKNFDFSLDPGTGPMSIKGRLDGLRMTLTISSRSGTRTETRQLGSAGANAQRWPAARGGGLVMAPPTVGRLRSGDDGAGEYRDRRS